VVKVVTCLQVVIKVGSIVPFGAGRNNGKVTVDPAEMIGDVVESLDGLQIPQ
jgi:hypothetical protein